MNLLPNVNSIPSNTNVILYSNDAIHQFAQGQEVHLAGQVIQYQSSQPSGIANVPFRVIDVETNSTIQNGNTDSKGEFGFTWIVQSSSVRSGTINLQAVFDGYGDYKGSSSNILSLNVISAQPQILNLPSTLGNTVGVSTDKRVYTDGDDIVISGQVSQVIPDFPIILRIQSPNGNLITTQQLVLQDKTFSTTINAGGNFWIEGSYTVLVQYTSKLHAAQATFEFKRSSPIVAAPQETLPQAPQVALQQPAPAAIGPHAESSQEPSTNTTPSPPGNQSLAIIIILAGIVGMVALLVNKSRKPAIKGRAERLRVQSRDYYSDTQDGEGKNRNEGQRSERPTQSVAIEFDPYRIMGLTRNVSCADVKTKFKELVKKNSLVGIINMSKEEKEQKEKILKDIILAKDIILEEKGCTN